MNLNSDQEICALAKLGISIDRSIEISQYHKYSFVTYILKMARQEVDDMATGMQPTPVAPYKSTQDCAMGLA